LLVNKDATISFRSLIGLGEVSCPSFWCLSLRFCHCFCKVRIFKTWFSSVALFLLIELVERGTSKALLRLAKHFLSLSPIFEVFSTQIYSNSILSNLTFGGARYIATGRGFATTRISFSILYSRFAGPSIYMGMRNLLLLLYATIAIWIPHLIYFWASVLSLCIAPFMFNPHQFSYVDFIIDYREFLRWMSRGNSRTKASSWYGYCRLSRTNITGYKKKKLGHPSEKLSGDVPRAPWKAVIWSEVVWPICVAVIFIIAYMFVKSFGNHPSPLIRIGIVAIGPVVWNGAVLVCLFFVSLFLGPVMEGWAKFGSVMAMLAHVSCLVGLVAFFEFFVSFFLLPVGFLVLNETCSGSLNYGTPPTRFWVSSRSLRSKGPFKNPSSPSSSLVNSNMTKRTVPGGLVNGTDVGWEPLRCLSLRESL